MSIDSLASKPFAPPNRSGLYATAVLASWLVCSPLNAAPTGGNVVAGEVTLPTTTGLVTEVKQHTPRAIITWSKFNVAEGELVNFTQEKPNSILLNRVLTSGSGSQINGNISAEQRIFIVDPRGIVFGPKSKINVAGLVATTADTMDSTAFMRGAVEFTKAGLATASVRNNGTITAPGGSVVLLAPLVENRGTITANGGTVVLGTGHIFYIDMFGDGLVSVATARVDAPVRRVVQMGNIDVGSGAVLLLPGNTNQLVGTLNSIPVAQLANQAIPLADGAIAFLGSSSHEQTSPSDWRAPRVLVPGNNPQGAGVIDASPVYSVSIPMASGPATRPDLAEFNRLPDLPGSYVWADRDNSVAGAADANRVGALYTTLEWSHSSPLAQAVTLAQEPPASARPTTRGAPGAATGGRYCTVAELNRSRTAKGCR